MPRHAWACTCACGLSALAACSQGPGPKAGVDPGSGWVDATSPPSSAAPPPRPEARWDLEEQLRGLRPAVRRARSEHLGGDVEGEILANPASGYPLHGPASRAAAGTTLVERLYPAGAAQPTTLFVMVKRAPGYNPPGGDWEYLVVGLDGRIAERGQLALCGRCHAEAPHDHLFGGAR